MLHRWYDERSYLLLELAHTVSVRASHEYTTTALAGWETSHWWCSQTNTCWSMTSVHCSSPKHWLSSVHCSWTFMNNALRADCSSLLWRPGLVCPTLNLHCTGPSRISRTSTTSRAPTLATYPFILHLKQTSMAELSDGWDFREDDSEKMVMVKRWW